VDPKVTETIEERDREGEGRERNESRWEEESRAYERKRIEEEIELS
jgi:hypothetical protein